MTARSRERGSHAYCSTPGCYSLPFPDPRVVRFTQTPSEAPSAMTGLLVPSHQEFRVRRKRQSAPECPVHSGLLGRGLPLRPSPGSAPRSGASRHRKSPERKSLLSGKAKMAVVLVLVVAALAVGFSTGFGSEESAEPAVQAFLLDWQQGKYAQAAALTNGDADRVTDELAAAYTDVDATNAFFAMKSVSQHGSTATAEYQATVDLAQPGEQWTYTGQVQLTSVSGQWLIDWAPEAINPALAAGDRLAVVTSFPQRAPITDMNGSAARGRVRPTTTSACTLGAARQRGGHRREVQRRHRA